METYEYTPTSTSKNSRRATVTAASRAESAATAAMQHVETKYNKVRAYAALGEKHLRKTFTTLVEMLADRGYESFYVHFPTDGDFRGAFLDHLICPSVTTTKGQHKTTTATTATAAAATRSFDKTFRSIMYTEGPGQHGLNVFVCLSGRVGLKACQQFLQWMDTSVADDRNCIILSHEGATGPARKILSAMYNTRPAFRLQIFHFNELQFNIGRHALQPRVTMLSAAKVDEVCKQYCIQNRELQLPKRRINDALMKYYGLFAGQIVKIRHCNGFQEPLVYYVYIVAD
jgi:DNA-directed RNA polymerase subunit H (RpoH/RPB5)